EALFVAADPFFISQRDQFATLTARYRIPAAYSTREDVEAGGRMSYGADNQEMYRQVGIYTGQILKGAKPADLPVLQSTKFEFLINLQTAKALGIEVPNSILIAEHYENQPFRLPMTITVVDQKNEVAVVEIDDGGNIVRH